MITKGERDLAESFEEKWEILRQDIAGLETKEDKMERIRESSLAIRKDFFKSLGYEHRKSYYAQFLCAGENCFNEAVSSCKKCKNVFYCSKSCIEKDWPDHSKNCMSKIKDEA